LSSASAAAARRQHTLRGRPCKASLVSRGPSHQHTPLRPSCPRRCHVHSPPHKGETGTKTLQSNSRAEQQQRAEKTAARQARLQARRPKPAPPHGVARELGLHGARRGPRRAPRRAVWRRGWFDHPPPLAVPRSAAARARGSAAAHASSRPERLESAQRSRPAWMFSSKASAPGEPAPATCGMSLIRSVGSSQHAPPRGRRGSSRSARGGDCSQVGARSARVCTDRLRPAEGP